MDATQPFPVHRDGVRIAKVQSRPIRERRLEGDRVQRGKDEVKGGTARGTRTRKAQRGNGVG